MLRKEFLKQTGLFAIGIGAFGKLKWDNNQFLADTPTTTDILGPFYRPNAPFRTNLNPANFNGHILHLSGTIYKKDGITPINNCLMEIWQCKEDGFYDNVSDDFLYRASQRVRSSGKYNFITTPPIPYPTEVGGTIFRPAHIHMRISVEGQQDLITQIYLNGDPYLETDPSTKSELCINRILPLKKKKDNESEIKFDIILRKEYVPDSAIFHKVCGVYQMSDKTMMEFYRDGDLLFYKINNQIWGGLSYIGNNSFEGGVNDTEANFELLPQGRAKVKFRFSRRREIKIEGIKALDYAK